jgi:hypothetical protein
MSKDNDVPGPPISSPRGQIDQSNGLEMLASDIGTPSKEGSAQSTNPPTIVTSSSNAMADEEEAAEREQRLVYLKQAFCGFFKAKQTVEMQHLARVICAILGVSVEEQELIMESIIKLSPAVVATSTLEMFSQQFASIFS